MTRGVLIFAHNNRDIDYALMSIISGGLAKKHLDLPVSLVTDISTIDWMKHSDIYDKALDVFDKILITDKPKTDNSRRLHDGDSSKFVPFVNLNRNDAYELTPYYQTLLIDSDYLIFSSTLNNFWEYSDRVLLGSAINDIVGSDRLGYHDRYTSDTGVHLYWATTVMFTKNEYAKSFFTILAYVKNNYQYFSDLFRFSVRNYRNDIAFSITQHIIDGFETKSTVHLPAVFSCLDRDILYSVDDTGKILCLINKTIDGKYFPVALEGTDIHLMNKASIVRNSKKLLELV